MQILFSSDCDLLGIVAFNDTFIHLGLCSSIDHFPDVSPDKYFITYLKNMKNVVCGHSF